MHVPVADQTFELESNSLSEWKSLSAPAESGYGKYGSGITPFFGTSEMKPEI